MTDDYELSVTENNELYDEYLSIVNSKNELQAQLDNLVSEINSISCPPIELASPSMKLEQLFCIISILVLLDLSMMKAYTFSINYDSIPAGMSVSNSELLTLQEHPT